jgi:predicted transcriptional regulator
MSVAAKASVALKEATYPKRGSASFANIPCCALRDPNLLGSDLRVYAILLLLGGDTKKVVSGLDEIASRTALSRRGANRAVMRLQKLGYIAVQRRRRQSALISVRSPYDIYGNSVFDTEAAVALIRPQRTKKLVKAHSAP